MFHFSKWLIFNYFITKNETWKINQKFWKCMDIMWDKLQFKSCESLTEFCNFAHGFEFWVLFFLSHLSYSCSVIYGNAQSLFYAINSASNSKSEIWVFILLCVRFALTFHKLGCISAKQNQKNLFFILLCVRFALTLRAI